MSICPKLDDDAFLTKLPSELHAELRHRVGNATDREELVSEIICACTAALRERRSEIANRANYCRSIQYNQLNSYYRSKSQNQARFDAGLESLDDLEGQSPSRGAHLRPYLHELDDFMRSQLTGPQLQVLELRAVHGLSGKEIAEILGISHSAVRSLLCAARKKLAKHLGLPEDELGRSDEDDDFDEICRRVAELGRALGR